MALVHQHLYNTSNSSQIEMKRYTKNLIHNLLQVYNARQKEIEIKTYINDITLNLTQAVPCGMLINEIVSNSIKYAFPGKKAGIIEISMNKYNDTIQLKISDNGIGIENETQLDKLDSLGLNLISAFVEQLEGDLDLNTMNGTKYSIKFPVTFSKAD